MTFGNTAFERSIIDDDIKRPDILNFERYFFQLGQNISGMQTLGLNFDAFIVQIIEALICNLLLFNGIGIQNFVIFLKCIERIPCFLKLDLIILVLFVNKIKIVFTDTAPPNALIGIIFYSCACNSHFSSNNCI